MYYYSSEREIVIRYNINLQLKTDRNWQFSVAYKIKKKYMKSY